MHPIDVPASKTELHNA